MKGFDLSGRVSQFLIRVNGFDVDGKFREGRLFFLDLQPQ
jgi:hypothetical protein